MVAVPSASEAAMRPAPSQVTEVTGCGAGSRAVSAREARFHVRTSASELPAASVAPSGLNATALTHVVALARLPSALALTAPPGPVPGVSFHSHTLESRLEAASSRPSGANATPLTVAAGPFSVAARAAGGAGRGAPVRVHSRTASSAPPAASVRPSGLNATDSTAPD